MTPIFNITLSKCFIPRIRPIFVIKRFFSYIRNKTFDKGSIKIDSLSVPLRKLLEAKITFMFYSKTLIEPKIMYDVAQKVKPI